MPICLTTSTHHPCAQKLSSDMHEWVLSCGSYRKSHEMLQMAGHGPHKKKPSALARTPISMPTGRTGLYLITVSSVIHSALSHLETRDSYVRQLFLDFSSAFNTIIPQTLVNKLLLLVLKYHFVNGSRTFWQRGHKQAVKIDFILSASITLNTSIPLRDVSWTLYYTCY